MNEDVVERIRKEIAISITFTSYASDGISSLSQYYNVPKLELLKEADKIRRDKNLFPKDFDPRIAQNLIKEAFQAEFIERTYQEDQITMRKEIYDEKVVQILRKRLEERFGKKAEEDLYPQDFVDWFVNFYKKYDPDREKTMKFLLED